MPVIIEDHSELLQRALRRVSSTPLDPLERKTLYGIVQAFVDDMRADNSSPEQIVLVLKRAAYGAGFRPALAHTDATINAKAALLHDMVDWCIHRYYVRSE